MQWADLPALQRLVVGIAKLVEVAHTRFFDQVLRVTEQIDNRHYFNANVGSASHELTPGRLG